MNIVKYRLKLHKVRDLGSARFAYGVVKALNGYQKVKIGQDELLPDNTIKVGQPLDSQTVVGLPTVFKVRIPGQTNNGKSNVWVSEEELIETD